MLAVSRVAISSRRLLGGMRQEASVWRRSLFTSRDVRHMRHNGAPPVGMGGMGGI